MLKGDSNSSVLMCVQAALDRFEFMTPTTALGVLVALQPLALLKKHIQVIIDSTPVCQHPDRQKTGHMAPP